MEAVLRSTAPRPSLISRVRSQWLFRRDKPVTTVWQALGWWELRRIPFNAILLVTGFFAGLLCLYTNMAAVSLLNLDFGFPDPPLFVIIAAILYGIMANICYSGGWIVELFVRRIRPAAADRFASSSFYFGVCFSVLLTLSPGILVVTEGSFLLLRHLLRATGKS
jgi:hypothetical protein